MNRLRLVLSFFAFVLLTPSAFAQAADVEILSGETTYVDVCGNGDPANYGECPATLPDTASNFSVDVQSGGTVDGGDVYGGRAESSTAAAVEASRNQATISGTVSAGGGGMGGYVYGGSAINSSASGSATADNNIVLMYGSASRDVYGGRAESVGGSATVIDGSVFIDSGSTVSGSVYGGSARTNSGTATLGDYSSGMPHAVIEGTVNVDVYGGFADSTGGTATANGYVNINSSGSAGSVYGGMAETSTGSAIVVSGSATITGAATNDVYGGRAHSSGSGSAIVGGPAVGYNVNRVAILNNGNVTGNVYGASAFSDSGTASITNTSSNFAIVRGNANVTGDVHGGRARSNGGSATIDGANSASIEDNGEAGDVYGGFAYSTGTGSATITGTNSATVQDDAVANGNIYGGVARTDDGTATVMGTNSATIQDNGVASRDVYGGYAWGYNDGATEVTGNNTATLSGTNSTGATTGEVYGARAQSAGSGAATVSATSVNTAFVSGNRVTSTVYGVLAYSGSNTASVSGVNNATVSGDATYTATTGDVVGGWAESGSGAALLSGVNTATISSVNTTTGSVYGGRAMSDATGAASVDGINTVNISGGTTGNVYGGSAQSQGTGAATVTGNNSVEISGGTAGNNPYGEIYGGHAWSDSGIASVEGSNTATVSGGDVRSTSSTVYGGYAWSDNNSASVTGDNLTGYSSATVSSGQASDVYGGYAVSNLVGTATVDYSHATISGGLAGYVYGGSAHSASDDAIASNNSVTISNGRVTGYVYGGIADSDGAGKLSDANHNTVTISGGTLEGDVYGGVGWVNGYGETGSATYNTINLSGSPTFNVGNLYGGWVGIPDTSKEPGDAFTGNTLNVLSRSLRVRSIYNFEYLYFLLPANFVSTDTMLTVTHEADIDNSIVTVGINGNSTLLSVGQQVVLIDSTANPIYGTPFNLGDTVDVKYGATAVIFRGTLEIDDSPTVTDGRLVLNVNNVTPPVTPPSYCTLNPTDPICNPTPPIVDPCIADPTAPGCTPPVVDPCLADPNAPGCTPPVVDPCIANPNAPGCTPPVNPPVKPVNPIQPESKALSEGHLADMILLNRGANMVAGQGMREAFRVGRQDRLTGDKSLWAVLAAGTGEYETGSHVDMDSVSLMAGLSANQTSNAGEASFGAFLEAGNGNYDTYNRFVTVGRVKGDGKNHYWGGGLLGRMDFAETGSGNAYLEGSLRAGKVKNNYHSGLRDVLGNYAHFKTSANYASLHVGGGYRWKLNETSVLDLYGQAFYTREGGDNVRLTTINRETVKFAAVNSNRIRLGGRYEWMLENVTPYVGLAYEHEFDGKAKAKITIFGYDYKVDTPDLKGGTGIAEIGFIMRPSRNHPFTINLGIQGYVGKQQGVTGSLRMKYEF